MDKLFLAITIVTGYSLLFTGLFYQARLVPETGQLRWIATTLVTWPYALALDIAEAIDRELRHRIVPSLVGPDLETCLHDVADSRIAIKDVTTPTSSEHRAHRATFFTPSNS